jgi:hypothetical protein
MNLSCINLKKKKITDWEHFAQISTNKSCFQTNIVQPGKKIKTLDKLKIISDEIFQFLLQSVT